MCKEPIYRIKVEVIGEERDDCKLDKKLKEGIECAGFVILADKEDSSSVLIHGVSTLDIATMIAPSGAMMAASILAKAMREGKKYLGADRNPLADVFKAMAGELGAAQREAT